MAQLDFFIGEQKETNCSVEEIPMTTIWRGTAQERRED